MDPLTGAIVGAVVLFFLREIVFVAIIWIGILIGVAVGAAFDMPWATVGIGVLAWILGLAWEVFAIVWIIQDIIHIVQIASGVA